MWSRLALLSVLLAVAVGTGWWHVRAHDRAVAELAALTSVRGAVGDLAGLRGGTLVQHGFRGLPADPALREAAVRLTEINYQTRMYAALDTLDAAELTTDEGAFRKPLRLAVDDYYASGGAAEGPGELADELLASLDARCATLTGDMDTARAVSTAATGATALLIMLGAALMIRSMLRLPRG